MQNGAFGRVARWAAAEGTRKDRRSRGDNGRGLRRGFFFVVAFSFLKTIFFIVSLWGIFRRSVMSDGTPNNRKEMEK